MLVADLILNILAKNNVEHVFGIPGDAINNMTDAIRRQDDIKFILVRHEEAAAFAASAQAKLTGKLSACMGTAGPGAIHLLNGLYDAKMDHAPVIAITGQVETAHIGTSYHQEVDLERLFQDVALYSQTITSPYQLPVVVQEACRAAITGRGVAHISLPTDLAEHKINIDDSDISTISVPGEIHPKKSDCLAAIELLNNAKRVVILAGIGCGNATQQLVDLSSRLAAPIVRTLRAKDVIDDSHESCIGGIGMLGGKPAESAMRECDLLLIIGSDFPYRDFYPKNAKVIQIDSDATQIGKRYPVDVALVGNAGSIMEVLISKIVNKQDATFMTKAKNQMHEWREKQFSAEHSQAIPIKPQRILREISNFAPDDTIFVCDTGTVDAWAARHLHVKEEQRFTLSSALGSMAFALPGAIGAQLKYPDRHVMAIVGDGGFTMLMSEFLTAVQQELPIVVVVLNNDKLGLIGMEQQAKGLPEHSIRLSNPNFARYAEICGGVGYRVYYPHQFVETLKEALYQTQPVIIDVLVDSDEVIIPPRINFKQAINFSISKAKEFTNEITG